ncbi:regulator of G protein signaling 20 [Phyllostomus discolor]|uniref:Regulator of G protein signaling 20 n=1 Tax=Phyllostomus discolor TaxID=89673 RepID=A0A834E273_9CHIR|nr:regulator of G protein signaling 20 [Phyllostomus discolor]
MPRLSQDNQECLQKHFSSPSMWTQCLPLPRAEGYNANIHQTTRKEKNKAVCDIKIPDLPFAQKLVTLLSSTLYSLMQFFSHLLRRPPPETPQKRLDFSRPLPARPGTGLLGGNEEWPGRLSLLLQATLTLPGRSPGERLPQEEDASTGQRWFTPVSTVVSTVPSSGHTRTPASPTPS